MAARLTVGGLQVNRPSAERLAVLLAQDLGALTSIESYGWGSSDTVIAFHGVPTAAVRETAEFYLSSAGVTFEVEEMQR